MSTPLSPNPARNKLTESAAHRDDVNSSSALGRTAEKNTTKPLDFLLISDGEDFSDFNESFRHAVGASGFSLEALLSHEMEGNHPEERADHLKKQIENLHRQARIGKHTQVIINFHGEKSASGLQFSTADDALEVDALALISCLRSTTPPAELALHATPPRWTGTIHITACFAGTLRDQLQNREGKCILYNGKKTTQVHDGDDTILELVRQLEVYAKKHKGMPSPRDIWKIVSNISGESISLVGDQAIDIHRTLDPTSKKLKIDDLEVRAGQRHKSLYAKLHHGSITKVVALLDKYGPEILHEDSHVMSTLSLAAHSRRDKIKKIDLLLAMGKKINDILENQKSLLHIACELNDFSLVKHLVSARSIQTALQDNTGSTALHLAVAAGNAEIAKYLAHRADADLTIDNQEGQSVRILGAKNTKFAINIPDKEGNTPLHLASKQSNITMLKALLHSGIDFSLKNARGRTALELAIRRGRTDIARKLVENGAPVNAQNAQGNTALHIACQLNNKRMIDTLLSFGADPAIPNNTGLSPLCYAARRDKLDAVKLLLSSGSVNVQSNKGNTALHFACLRGNNAMATLLLKHGALPDLKNKAGKSPIDISQTKTTLPVMTLLLNRRLLSTIFDAYDHHDIASAAHALSALPASVIADSRLTSLLETAVGESKLAWVKILVEAHVDTALSLRPFKRKNTFYGVDADIIKTLLTTKNHKDRLSEKLVRLAESAVLSGRIDRLTVMIEGGADIHHVFEDDEGPTTLLSQACNLNKSIINQSLVNWLISHGGDLDFKNTNGRTPLEQLILADALSFLTLHSVSEQMHGPQLLAKFDELLAFAEKFGTPRVVEALKSAKTLLR